MPAMKTPSEIIKALGGEEIVAKHCNVGLKALYMWERRGFIPGNKQVSLLLLAAERGVALSPCDFVAPKEGVDA